MNIAIVGFDREGHSSFEYFSAQGHRLTICDQKTDIVVPQGADSILGPQYLDNLDRFDLIVRTAGLPPRLILDKNPAVKDKITSQTNEFFKVSPTKNIIGVTGTKGKGTTSTLISKMLEASGKHVALGGNIGIPPLDLLKDLDSTSWVVLELSSFQLSDCRYSPHIAVCLMIAPEHLNWHLDVEDYFEAKANLFTHQTTDDLAIYFADNGMSQKIAARGQGQLIPFFAAPGALIADKTVSIDGQAICQTAEVKLLGRHNLQNICAAITACWQITHDVKALRHVVTSFSGLPYRLEFRGEKQGVSYYNDSFASAPPAPLAAIQAVAGQKVVILGGFDRGLDLEELVQGLAGRSDCQYLLIGDSASRLTTILDSHAVTNYTVSQAREMSIIVSQATALASGKGSVILSPGFASFDMFKNFEDRGQQFNEVVNKL